jgi:hypothetical protein
MLASLNDGILTSFEIDAINKIQQYKWEKHYLTRFGTNTL